MGGIQLLTRNLAWVLLLFHGPVPIAYLGYTPDAECRSHYSRH